MRKQHRILNFRVYIFVQRVYIFVQIQGGERRPRNKRLLKHHGRRDPLAMTPTNKKKQRPYEYNFL